MTSDTVHSYTYDAEGNITKVDVGNTAQYVYDAFNRRIHVQTASATTEFIYDYAGRRISSWLSPNNYGNEGRIYWDGQQIAYRSADGTTYFDHQDTLGTERMRTNYGGSVGSTYVSLPWGDGYTATVNSSGADQDNNHFAGLERDAESGTEHAQFRNYASAQGRWLAPDSYLGSYDVTNPQSMNRYVYVLNNPTSLVDPSGLEDEQACGSDEDCVGSGDGSGEDGGGAFAGGNDIPVNPGDPFIIPIDAPAPGVSDFELLYELPPSQVFSGLPAVVGGGSGRRGPAPNNQQYTPYHPPSKLLKYVTFLGCEFNSDIEQLTDEEDAQAPVALTVLTAGAVGTIAGKFPGWVGITAAITGGAYVINIAGNSNKECTESVYGH